MHMIGKGERRAGVTIGGFAIAVVTVVGAIALGGQWAGAQPGDDVDPEHGDHYHAADLANQNRFTGQGEVWPPRPDGAGAPRSLPIAEPRYDDDPIIADIATDGRVAELLGEQWTVLAIGPAAVNGKGAGAAAGQGRIQITFFSRSTNQSVIVDVTGRRVADVATVDPAVEQLPLNPEEKADAVDIARRYWLDAGETSVDNLEGFAIQAYQPGGSLYDVRMAYVSFHVDADSRPELLAWVDLTNEVVTEAREER